MQKNWSDRKIAEDVNRYLTKPEIEKKIRKVRKAMEEAAKSLDFIEAAKYRDEIKSLQKQLQYYKMYTLTRFFIFIFLFSFSIKSQELTGIILDETNKKPIPFSSIYLKSEKGCCFK